MRLSVVSRVLRSGAGACPCRVLATPPRLFSSTLRAPTLRRSMGGGGVTAELTARMQSKIQVALEARHVKVHDTSGDGRHVVIEVVSDAFEGKSAVNRQRMVYKVRAEWGSWKRTGGGCV